MKIGLIIDLQNGFVKQPQTEKIAQKITDLISKKPFDYLIATRFINKNDSTYEKLLGWKGLKTIEEQTLFHGVEENIDFIFNKTTYSCVNEEFLNHLRKINDGTLPDKIYIMGVDTDCCVLTIATALFDQGICPIVLKDYCESNGGSISHNAGLVCLNRLIGDKNVRNYLDFN